MRTGMALEGPSRGTERFMKLLTIVVVSLLAVLSLFAILNWSTIATPAPVSVGFTTVNAPLGLIMLLATALLTAAFLAFIIYQQATGLVDARRFARDLHASRELADKAEASRFTDLRAFVEGELRKLGDRQAAASAEGAAALARVEQVLLAKLSASENGLSAHVAEVEDKLDRALRGRTSS
jgi:uncharacterized integral membrane protein